MKLDKQTQMAISATLHCLTGCAIGEVLGMAIATALGWGDISSIALAVALAFFFGYLLSVVGIVRADVILKQAIRLAVIADTVSIASMEIIDNAVIWLWPGALDTELGDFLFWASLGIGLFLAFLLTVPLNRWLIAHGKGHAVVHDHHH